VRVLGGAGVLVAVAVALSACGASHTAGNAVDGTSVALRTVTSSRLVLHGRVRCTATVSTPVEAGHEIEATFSLRIVSGSTARAPLDEASTALAVRAGDGTRYDTAAALRAEGSFGGPARMPVVIHRGQKRTFGGTGVSVRWKGPLRITPSCEQKELPDFRSR